MLANYLDQAMELAVYEIIEDEGTYWGEVPGLEGVVGKTRNPREMSAGVARGIE